MLIEKTIIGLKGNSKGKHITNKDLHACGSPTDFGLA